MRSACSTVIPQPRAQPSAALVGLPSASKAADTAGPRFSISLLGCCVAKFNTFTAKRRGAANHSILSNDKPARFNSASTLSAKEVANVLRAFGGSSSVPISTRKFWVVILFSLVRCDLAPFYFNLIFFNQCFTFHREIK